MPRLHPVLWPPALERALLVEVRPKTSDSETRSAPLPAACRPPDADDRPARPAARRRRPRFPGACLGTLQAGDGPGRGGPRPAAARSEEHTSELQSLMRTSYAVFCLQKKTT